MVRWTSLAVCAGVCMAMLQPCFAAEKYYKWIDQHGTVQYTQTPPPPSARKVLKVVQVSTHVPADVRAQKAAAAAVPAPPPANTSAAAVANTAAANASSNSSSPTPAAPPTAPTPSAPANNSYNPLTGTTGGNVSSDDNSLSSP